MRRPWLVPVVIAAIAMAAPAAASAVTVSAIDDKNVKLNPYAKLAVDADPGEANRLSVTMGEVQGKFLLTVRDDAVPSVAGEGCAGGGRPGSTVTCLLRVPPETTTVKLGNGGSSIDASTLPVAVIVWGGAGDDSISTGSGPDSVFSTRGGPNAIEGPSGDDLIRTGDASDFIEPGDGSNEVQAGSGDDWVIAPETPNGADVFNLEAGDHDVVDYHLRTQPLTYVADTLANDGALREGDAVLSAEFIAGGSGDDELLGDGRNDYLFGGGGNDLLAGGTGSDLLAGEYGEEDDLGWVDEVDVTRFRFWYPLPRGLDFEPGRDLAFGGPGDDSLHLDGGADLGVGGTGRDFVSGNAGPDTLLGRSGPDKLYGKEGRDRLLGQRGRNLLNGGSNFDRCRRGSRSSVAVGCEG